jgi:hypothetical protein
VCARPAQAGGGEERPAFVLQGQSSAVKSDKKYDYAAKLRRQYWLMEENHFFNEKKISKQVDSGWWIQMQNKCIMTDNKIVQ